MLQITVPGGESFNEQTSEFIYNKEQTLQLEHSLVSMSKWEAKWKKPFLSKDEKTKEETIDYIKCMNLTQNVKPEVWNSLTSNNIKDVLAYIKDPMTATSIKTREGKSRGSNEIVTSELIYYWMVSLQIPFECQRWHLNRLLMLIKVCNVKNNPGKKMGRGELMRSNYAINAARRKKLGTSG